MRLFRREEGGFTIADWDDGFFGLSRIEERTGMFGFQFERWPCCPGSLELSLKLFGFRFVIYNEGGPCQLEAYLDEEEETGFELAQPVQLTIPANGNDWYSVPSPASR